MCLTCGVLAQYVRPMRRCLYRTYPQYLAAHCTPVSAIASRHHLRSAAASLSVCCAVLPPVSYTHLTLPTNREV